MEKMYPIENTLCVFNAKEDKNIFILGYLYFSISDREFVIKNLNYVSICFKIKIIKIHGYSTTRLCTI